MEKMRAARSVELGKMVCELTEVRPPEEGEVIVRTQLAAICGSDLHIVFMGSGIAPLNGDWNFPHGFPGHEGIGEVVESRFAGLKIKERVLTVPGRPYTRCFAETLTLPGSSCITVPEDLPLAELLMAQQLGTAIFALRQNPVDVVGKNVMVMGQGSAGVFFAYLLKRAGAAKVIVSDLSEARLDLGRQVSGTDVAVIANGGNVKEAVMDHTGGEGVDYLVEAVGRSESQLESVEYMKLDGKMLFFGLPDTSKPIPFNFQEFFRKRITANTTYGTQFEPGLASFRLALDLIIKKEIDVSKLVSHTFPIEQIDEAMHQAHEGAKSTLKVALSF
ncbi:MAG: zinc-binding dehydrogenase [SAR324 cluster bacterium]|nr:zinc-binding dehydrogenase [SAR324 cluster bacterium]MCZ6645289.1 zinc-binding dehydrogenase [SAR324 cluster bacterium]MCZ6728249.1 zinc-binding dehydrogenase [SAR324 cluster bacterium]MCZ6843536.1 zinc-binding dehydrogenase [SAR324 cluster bacterium]